MPVVHLCGKTWFLRRGRDGTGLKAYANAPQLTLTLNGQTIGTRRNGEYRQHNTHPVENVFYWDPPPQPGKYRVTVSDASGHSNSAVIDFEGARGEQGLPDSREWVQNLVSHNRANPARFIDEPIQPEWPIYDDFDGTGDNTFHTLPDVLAGARWITMRRPSRKSTMTALDFQIAPTAGPTDIFVLGTATSAPPPFLRAAGFADTHITGAWRDNDMTLVPFALYRKTFAPDAHVHLGSAMLDYVVLVKPHEAAVPTTKSH